MEQRLMTRDGAQGAKLSLSINFGCMLAARKEVEVRGAGSLAVAIEGRRKAIREEFAEDAYLNGARGAPFWPAVGANVGARW